MTLEKLTRRTERRRLAEASGRDAEAKAAEWYAMRGCETLGHRLRTARGEIDLIVADGAMVVFVEVKARRRADQAAYAVTPRQQMRLAGAAEIVLAEHPEWGRDATRFDVVLVVGDVISVIPDAFRPGDLQ